MSDPGGTVRAIRCARPAEIAALEELQLRSSSIWEEYRDLLIAYPDAIELPRDQVDDERVRVAESAGGGVLGFSAVLAVADGACELDGLFVEPEHLRAGIGTALVDDVVQRARQAGARELNVTAGPRTVLFYEKLGFVQGAPVQTRFGVACRMRMDLGSAGAHTTHG